MNKCSYEEAAVVKVDVPVVTGERHDSTGAGAVNPERVARVRRQMEEDGTYARLADMYRILGDLTRVKIIRALSLEELCVCDIAGLLEVSQSAVSHQLRILRNMRIVRYRREGKKTYYCLDDDHIQLLFSQGFDHISERGL
jgi:DNA-binding transcriptional ArsR family regulator